MLQDIATVFWRDWVVLRQRMKTFIVSRMVTPVLYLVAFGWGLGRSVQMDGGSYLDFIVPGILALNSMNISFSSVGSPLSMSRLYHKTLEEYLVAPISSTAFVLGKIFAGTLRGLISSGIIIALAYLFGARFYVNLSFLLIVTLNCMTFAGLGFVVAMLVHSHEEMSNFSTYVLLPMSFLCATFFNISKLPTLVRSVIEWLPLTNCTYALRMIGAGGSAPIAAWINLTACVLLLVGISVWTMERVRR